VRREIVVAVTDAPGVRLSGGRSARYEAVVVATGPWTPALLAASGLSHPGLRTRRIQYLLHPGGAPVSTGFVDATTGLYGRPAARGRLLIGLPSAEWDAAPRPDPDRALAGRTVAVARRRLGVPLAPAAAADTVAAADCYTDPPGLCLRPLAGPGLYTFTGGSGGAAKTALAASRAAAAALLRPLADAHVAAASTATGREAT
jgi:glycine/D-amino acid oxidase-like deaminating enzyme